MIARAALLLVASTLVLPSQGVQQDPIDPTLRLAVERFFATQEAEQIDAYLALWSASAQRPQSNQLKYIFDSGDDKYSDIAITRVESTGVNTLRIRVNARRQRTQPHPRPEAPPIVQQFRMVVSMTWVREGTDWKLLREGPAVDDLAADLVSASTPEDRERLIAENPDVFSLDLVGALGRLGTDAARKQAYAQAQHIYERSLDVARRLQNRRAEAEALQNLANAVYFQRDFARALALYEERLVLDREREDKLGMAAALVGMGTVRYAIAEYTAALVDFRAATVLQETMGDDAGLAATLISTGNVLFLQGDFSAAIADYRRSRDMYKRMFHTAGEAVALDGLGRTLLAQGDLAAALEAFSDVLAERVARKDVVGQGTSLMNIGEVHFRLGNLDTARGQFDRSRVQFEAAKDLANVGRAWQALALTDLVAARFDVAEQEYGKSIASCGAADDRECVAAATVGLGFTQAAQEKFKDAVGSYRKGIELFTGLQRREQAARATIGLSQALSGAGLHEDAIAAASRAKTDAVALSNNDILWRALVAEARAVRRTGDRGSALAIARAALHAIRQLQEAADVQPASPVPRDTSAAFATLAVLQAETGDAESAFETAERLRVHHLRTVLAVGEREITRGMTAEEREQERNALRDVVSLHAQISRAKGLPRPDAARIQELEQKLADAAQRRAAQQTQLFERIPELRIWRGLVEPVTRADVATALAEDAVLLGFVVDEDDVVLLAAWRGPEGPEFVAHVTPMTRRALAERVGKMLQPTVLKDAVAWRNASADLGKAIPPAVQDRLAAARQVIMMPHEILWRVPFEALPLGDAHLGDAARVTYAPALSAFVRLPMLAPTPTERIVAVAAPAVAEHLRERVQQTAPGWELRPADAAEREARLVVGDTDSEHPPILLGSEATEKSVRDRLRKAGTIHLAAPFRVNGASPLFSPLFLAGDAAADTNVEDNGVLEAREIINLDLQASVAVVTDGTSLSMRDAADQMPVVHWAWRAAGVSTLILSRWAGEPTVSDQLVGELHRHLREGESPDAALQLAKRAVRTTDGRSAPFYWAGWVAIAAR